MAVRGRLGGGSDVVVDLLFASSGIENEVVANADRLPADYELNKHHAQVPRKVPGSADLAEAGSMA